MEFSFKNIFDRKNVCIIVLCIICFIEAILMFCPFDTEVEVNIKNTNCTYSENIGRRIFFHICKKGKSEVYDIRYFWHEEEGYVKPDIIGVQLSKYEFQRVCLKC